uniref:Uncharacterized protein n=1 Tax=Meloidogyne enterolobii TaxID=390850 RepID=A0A6V7WV13_MELEN|nr:unnamed protein product [Meloidogyne enterolobii]
MKHFSLNIFLLITLILLLDKHQNEKHSFGVLADPEPYRSAAVIAAEARARARAIEAENRARRARLEAEARARRLENEARARRIEAEARANAARQFILYF